MGKKLRVQPAVKGAGILSNEGKIGTHERQAN